MHVTTTILFLCKFVENEISTIQQCQPQKFILLSEKKVVLTIIFCYIYIVQRKSF